MISLQTSVHVAGVHAADVFQFMLNSIDEQYQAWWPGMHSQFHTLERHSGYVGNPIYMDEFVGRRRLRMTGVVSEAVANKRIVWQMKAPLKIPARLSLDLEDDSSGVTITHTAQAGFAGVGTLLDRLIRLLLSEQFARDLDAHVRTEFGRLGVMLYALTPGAAPSIKAGRNRDSL